MTVRNLIRTLHLYVGLVAGFLFALFGVTGSWLTYAPRFDAALAGFQTPAEGRRPVSMGAMLASVRAASPDAVHAVRAVFPRAPDSPAVFYSNYGQHFIGPHWRYSYVDPYTGRVLASRRLLDVSGPLDSQITAWAFLLHSGFIFGQAGLSATGVIAVLCLLLLLSGVYLWWPRGRWAPSAFLVLAPLRSPAFIHQAHRVFGLYVATLLAVIAFTAIHFGLASPFRRVVAAVLPTSAPAHDRHAGAAAPPRRGPPLGVDAAISVAQRLYPRRELRQVVILPGGDYFIGLAPSDRAGDLTGETAIMVPGFSGGAVQVVDPARERAGDTVLRWQRPLHTGDAFGPAGRAVVFALGFAPLGLFATGLILWLRKRRGVRRAPAARDRVRPQTQA